MDPTSGPLLRFQTQAPRPCLLDVDEETGFVLRLDGEDDLGPVTARVHDFRIVRVDSHLFQDGPRS